MLIFIAHCEDELIYMNSNCRVGIIKQHLIQRCPPVGPTRAVDLIDTSGSLVYLSWFPNNENAMHLFRPFTTYLIVYLTPIPKLKQAVRIVPTLKNYWKSYPEVKEKIKKPLLLQTHNTAKDHTSSKASCSNVDALSAASALANPVTQNGSNSIINKIKNELPQKKIKKAVALFGKVKTSI